MPRKSKTKTLSGQPGQTPVAPRGGPYGAGERALESQRRAPIPDYAASASGSTPGLSPGSPGVESALPPQAPGDRLQQAMMTAQQMAPPQNMLTMPSQRPSEPLTAGLPIGAGPGTEVLNTGDSVVRTLRMLADITADPSFNLLAEQAAQRVR